MEEILKKLYYDEEIVKSFLIFAFNFSCECHFK